MRTIYLIFILTNIFSLNSISQPNKQFKKVELLNKKTESGQPPVDSLAEFKSDLYSDIKPFVQLKAGRYFEQFSICIKTDKNGSLDSVMVSDNMEPLLKAHFQRTQKKSVYNSLIRYSKLNGWKDTYLLMTVIILYEDIKPPTLANLLEHRESLQNTFSFNSRDLLEKVQPIRMLDPLILSFGKLMR